MTGLYIHIPFCETICHYCDFVKRVPKNDAMMTDYLGMLKAELETYRRRFPDVRTIYIGGGTPSMLSVANLRNLFDLLWSINPIEYTMEVNPESYSPDKGALMKAYGINRVSLGVQTFDSGRLAYLNRKHTHRNVVDTIADLRTQGFDNISIDLIFGIPGQTSEMIVEDLRMIQELKVSHVSWYQLILEEKTVFWHLHQKNLFHPVDDDTTAIWYEMITSELKALGYGQYEISNYALPGHESVHNTLYWTMQDYIGCGLGAHGFLDGIRYENHRTLAQYQEPFRKTSYPVTPEEKMAETLIFGLRMNKGIDLSHYQEVHHSDPFSHYPELRTHLENGLVTVTNNRLMLTERGRLLGNQVFMVFV